MRHTMMVPVRDREQFLEMYFEKGDSVGLFIQTEDELALGEPVDLEITFLEDQVTFRLRGEVKWRRNLSGRRSLPPGLGIEFHPEDDRAHNLLLDYAMGKEVTMVHREDRRFGAQLKVKVKAHGHKETHVTDDISENGAFILVDEPFEVGEVFDVHLRPPGSIFGITVQARVAWRRDEGRQGVGVEFVFDSLRKKDQISKLVGQLKTKMVKEVKVRVPRLARRDPR